jgi:hypothetical protein
LTDFKGTFMEWVRREIHGQKTQAFYETGFDRPPDC